MLTVWIVLLFTAVTALSVAGDLVRWAQRLSTDASRDVAGRTRKPPPPQRPLDDRPWF